MAIPVYRQLQVDAAQGILFGNNELATNYAGVAGSLSWDLPAWTCQIAGVDGFGTMRWADLSTKTVLAIPVTQLSLGDNTAGITASIRRAFITASRQYELPDKSGTVALADDVTPGYFDGFEIYTTATTIVVGAGEAEVNGKLVTYAGGTISDSRAATTSYSVYLKSDGTIERVTTAYAASPYYGNARKRNSGTGAADTRWLFSVRTNDGTTTTNYPLVRCEPGPCPTVRFKQNSGLAPLNLVATQNYAVATAVPFAGLAPPYATRTAEIRLQYGGTGAASRAHTYAGAPGTTLGGFNVFTNVPATGVNTVILEVDATPQFMVDGGSVSAFLYAYDFVR